jgi:glycine/D-amino acid oxidase-like deaminating enzyme
MVLRKVVMSSAIPTPSTQEVRSIVTSDSDHEKKPHELLPVPDPMISYWLSTPHRYANLRTTAHLPSSCDIAIIGSGMAGILTAYYILQTSQTSHFTTGTPIPSVVILDARDLCSGATARNGGHAKIKTATITGMTDGADRNAFQDYVHRVICELKTIVDNEGLAEECEFELRRSFDVFQDREEFEQVKSCYNDAVRKGEAWTRGRSVVGAEHVKQVTSIQDAVGAFSSEAASFWPYKLVTGLLEILVQRFPDKNTLNVQMNTVVTRLSSSPCSPATTATTTNVLETPRGTLTAQKDVLATNAYTAALLPDFSTTIIPYKGMNSHHTPAQPVHPHLTNTYNIHFASTSATQLERVDYLNTRPDGSIVVGGGSWLFAHDKKTWYNTVDDSAQTGHFAPHVEAHWTHYMAKSFLGWETANAEPDCVWTGIMGKTPDGMPHVGRVPEVAGGEDDDDYGQGRKKNKRKKKQQWMLAGFNGGGMAMIPLAAKAVAKMVVEDVGFEHAREESGMLRGFATGVERMA